jgi:trimeric autotransporter adhesin
MRKILFLIAQCFFLVTAHSQSIGIATSSPNGSAALDLTNTDKGLLIPRMPTTQITSIVNPAKGLLVYDSSLNQLMVNMGTPASPDWETIVAKSGWGLSGNSGTTAADFIGTTDNRPLRFKVNDRWAGYMDSATHSVYMGYGSGATSQVAMDNTAIGQEALSANTTGISNTANGANALQHNTKGSYNIAIGVQALIANTTGSSNIAIGAQAMLSNTSGNNNTVVGQAAMFSNTSGSNNTAVGDDALFYNTTGGDNTANGEQALQENTTGSDNAATGYQALFGNTYGSFNTGVGANALQNTTGSEYNTAIGYQAGATYDNGYNNVFVGSSTDVTGAGFYNVIAIGYRTIVTGSSVALFGNPATTSYGGWANWSNISDGRFKTNIAERVPGLAFILKLRPVTYNLQAGRLDAYLRKNKASGKSASDQQYQEALEAKEKITYTGLVAQEVESAARQLGYDFSGIDKPKSENGYYGLRYADFVAPLVKSVQELARRNQDLKRQLEELKAIIKQQGQ